MKPPDIGYMVPQFPGQTHGFFWREILEMERMGAAVNVLSTRRPPAGIVSHEWSDEAIARTTYISVPGPRALLSTFSPRTMRFLKGPDAPSLKNALPLLPHALELVRFCRDRKIRHVHVHSCANAALVAAMARCLGGVPYSLTLHGALKDYGPEQPFKWRHAEFGIAITDSLMTTLRAELADDLPARLVRQAMGVDTDFFRRESAYEPYPGTGAIRIFSCARLNRSKGHQDTLHAVCALRDAGVDVDLRIAGEDESGGSGFRRELEAEIARLGLQDQTTLLGAVDAATIRDELLGCHVFVLASWKEPIGVAYMEAMSCEVPTIGTDAGGVGELIRDGVDGKLVPPRDPRALAAAIRELAADPEQAAALGRQSRNRVVEKFAARRSAEVLLEEISRTLR